MKGYVIIPARGGSKRIPRKNTKLFCGIPIIQRVIDAAARSALFERIVVSTEDAEIAELAVAAGAEVPFLRPLELADDHTGVTDVVRDAVRRLGASPDLPVCCLYATSVFATPENLRRGYEALKTGRAKWAFSVTPFPAPIQRAYRRTGDIILPFEPSNITKRSQDLEPAFFDVSQFWWALAETWIAPHAYPWDGATPVEIDPLLAVDIDTPDDWRRAELLFQAFLGHDDKIEQDRDHRVCDKAT